MSFRSWDGPDMDNWSCLGYGSIKKGKLKKPVKETAES